MDIYEISYAILLLLAILSTVFNISVYFKMTDFRESLERRVQHLEKWLKATNERRK